MSAQIVVELPAGRKLLFGGGAEAGLAEVGVGDEVARVGRETFQAALGSLSDLVAMLESSVGKLDRRPDKIEMEFGASLTGDCNLWIVSGEAGAEFKVTLAWEK
jgi:hypothetical protein